MFDDISSTALFLYLIVLLLSVISITLLVLLLYSGLFSAINDVGTGKPALGKVVIAYKFQKGPYNESGQVFTEAHMISPDSKSVGIYYDDPRQVASSELRYVVGSILASDPADVDPTVMSRYTEKGYKMMTLPQVEFAVQTKFPHVTTLSILIAVQKAYPRMNKYIEERKLCAHPYMEYYDGKDIHFMAPLSRQEEFWVPECHEGTGEAAGEAQEVNTTLDTSHSVLDESLDNTRDVSPDESVTGESQEEGKEAAEGASGPKSEEKEEAAGNDGADDEDNSSSSSFEVLKNETAD